MTGNTDETYRIMRRLGFDDDEMGRYVAALRARVAEMVAKEGIAEFHVHCVSPNLNNEERARAILELEWSLARGYSAQVDVSSLRRWRDLLPWCRGRLRILRMRYRFRRDRLLGIRNPWGKAAP